MKKIILVLFAVAFLFGGHTAFAAEQWNTASNDCLTVAIYNDSTNTGLGNPCWTRTQIDASPGDKIDVRIYYHNSGYSTAYGARVSLYQSPSNGPSSNYSFTGTVSSGSITKSGTAQVNISDSETLTFDEAIWYPNHTSTNGINIGSQIMNSNGVSIGDIVNGWDSQGSIVVSFFISDNNGNNNNNNNSQCDIISFDASPDYISNPGDRVRLSWDVNDADYLTITDVSGKIYDLNDSVSVYPDHDTTYTLRAYGNNCYETQNITVQVDDNYNYNSTPTVSTYTPSYIGTNSATIRGYAYGNYSNNNYNNNLIDAWLEFPCYGSRYGNQYDVNSANISATVYGLSPNTSYSYCAVAQGNNGQTYRGNTISFTTTGQYVPPVSTNIVTTIATNVDKNSAILNGLVTNNNNSNSYTNAYFEYGTTVNLGYKTASRSVNNGTNVIISDTVSGLSSGTIYFFRAVGENGGYVSRGNIEIFKTISNATSAPTVVQGKTVISTESPIMLKIENRYQSIGEGDTIDYNINYKNIGTKKLTNPMVQVILPNGIDFANASRGTYDNSTRTLSVPLEDLEPQAEGIIYVQAKAGSINKDNPQIVTTALLVYTNPSGAQENAMAYVINNPKGGNSLLGASALFANWMSNGLIWVLLFVIIILLIILIAQSFRRKNTVPNNITNHIH